MSDGAATASRASRPPPNAAGTFARTPFPHVLQYARERRLTGTLAVQCDEGAGDLAGETLLAFFGGALVQARMPRVIDPLGLLLREQGAIDDAQLNASLGRLAEARGAHLHGEVLRAMGVCDEPVIERALREQLRRKVLRLFAVRREGASYQYFDAVDLLAGYGRERYAESVLPVIWRGVRSWPDEATIDAVLAQVTGRALRIKRDAAPDLARFEFDRNEAALLDVLRAEPLPPEVLARVAPDPRAARLLAYTLVVTKQVELSRSGETRAVTPGARQSGVMPVLPTASATPVPTAPEAATPSAPPHAAGPRRMPSFGQAPAVTPPRAPSGIMPAIRTSSSQSLAAQVPADARPAFDEAQARLRAMQDQTYYEMLGVPDGAPAERAASAFLELAARWHPDRAPAETPALRAAYHAVFTLLNEAQQTLCDETLRARYEPTMMGGGGTPNARRKVLAALEAADDARRGEACLKRHAYEDAEQWSRKALHGNPKEISAMLVLAQALLDGGAGVEAREEAEKILRGALALGPENDRVLYLLGLVLKRKGDGVSALKCFKRAVIARPENIDAMREVRLAQMRRANGQATHTPPPEDPRRKK